MALALRRVLVVGSTYLVVSWLVLRVAGWARVVLVLPDLFLALLRWGLAGGLVVALVLAWYYPSLGHHGSPPREGGAS